ncbi:GntR family transcriptional regulator [Patulibacter sp.]|uniref:GntR family transcriptional regulator n=1 Tax=Patulibacter sp. TaxID=1912859 RepID=UPI0027204F9E|nr:GntR family transcriptional regulator [Patulibacter sp.]MDO9409606.1 GntR family transcriptional regulator [Patulibacter sp.]
MAAPSTTSPSASRRAYEHVRRGLLDGTLADGELLSEGAVATAVGVSRTPVREAFLQLEAEGLLALYPKRGALVLPVTAREAREMFAARALVEADALRTILARPEDPALVPGLRAILDDQRRLHGAGDLVASAEADRRLHRAWVAAADNAVLLRFFDGLRDRQERMTVAMMRRGGVRPERLIEEHAAIVDAVELRDADLAVRLVGEHLAAARVAAADD